ncbi:relaxase/mobilization nuclease domain-containing protein [Rhodovulum sp. PH10]|uniref:relaxase/mobilization nuclease domain-containing protein n=1 Tax=Rhodovulum sp. PH10 TaxID=1187851 RepID=UPI00058EB98B|nr:relaxase/mobilization nuclease domain-containing protein [Rhodovulum sp. PH10]
MIVRFAERRSGGIKHGTSFKGLADYLMHDPDRAVTSERLAWTHTLNLANDHVPFAIDEMLWTVRAADALKRQEKVGNGGRRLESPVKHISLNWHPSDEPEREEMIAAVQEFLRHMGWDDRQAVLVAHDDKEHAHVHIMLNVVSPIDGRCIDSSYEKVRASSWALGYERAHARIHCRERLKPVEAREPSPTRLAWQSLKEADRENDRTEFSRIRQTPDYFERGEAGGREAKEWALLKTRQREQRLEFFTEGKAAFRTVRNQVFREIRAEYRDEWVAYYDAARRDCDADGLAAMKADILARQTADLEARRDAACKALRERRDLEYRGLLRQQKEQRAELEKRQEQGLPSYHLLEAGRDAAPAKGKATERPGEYFRGAANETCSPAGERNAGRAMPGPGNRGKPVKETVKVHDAASMSGALGIGFLGAIAELGERLFDGFFGGGSAERPGDRAPESLEADEKDADDKRSRDTENQQRAVEMEGNETERLVEHWRERRRQREHDRD